MSRRDARDIAFKLVFEYAFSKETKQDVFDEYCENCSADDKAYVSEVYFGVATHFDELTEKIAQNSEKFALDRVYKVDYALLLLALYEICYMDSIPYKVSVDEALNLASKYSSEKSTSFINGILSKFAR